MRADVYLFTHGYFESRSKAADAIKNSFVKVDGNIIDKASFELENGCAISISDCICPYVSRGGLKLEAALDSFGLDITDMKAIDIGASTGGFTDCLLQHGASSVTSVDSGSNQLHRKLLCDKRVISHENFNAKNLTSLFTENTFDIAVADLSFISQTLILTEAAKILKDGGFYIGLIKPQFEAGRSFIGKNGIVKNKASHVSAITRVLDCSAQVGLPAKKLMMSPITGGDGNTEYLFFAEKNCTVTKIDKETIMNIIYSK